MNRVVSEKRLLKFISGITQKPTISLQKYNIEEKAWIYANEIVSISQYFENV